jgi:hypothetical protein
MRLVVAAAERLSDGVADGRLLRHHDDLHHGPAPAPASSSARRRWRCAQQCTVSASRALPIVALSVSFERGPRRSVEAVVGAQWW